MNGYPDPHPSSGRRLVTVAQWHDRPDELVDEPAYFYRPESEVRGYDPWAQVDGCTRLFEGYSLWFSTGGTLLQQAGAPLYVEAIHYDALLGRIDPRHIEDMPFHDHD